ncbi:Yip1 family protein [Chloroflexus sp.]|uniref:Yip1 family protein n=1 Tax=Chloroflexus sp. TaxID=1904827 RepID=UPI0021DECAF7|nr:Yip1 family protein [Chloroflexus sp.]GIV92822.1 MAG: YIP1 family protein [Chloroflexus sp.]
MIQEMVNGSIAVLTRPSVQSFEQHERDNLVWALIYAVIASVINGILAAITAPLRVGELRAQLEAQGLPPDAIEAAIAQQGNPIIAIFAGIFGTIIGSLIIWGFIYLLGRAFGGTGNFGELAWGISLFSSPLAVAQSIVSVIPLVGDILLLGLSIYGVYLTYLAIQSGMNLPSQKALYIAIILLVITLLFLCVTVGLAAIVGLIGGLAP